MSLTKNWDPLAQTPSSPSGRFLELGAAGCCERRTRRLEEQSVSRAGTGSSLYRLSPSGSSGAGSARWRRWARCAPPAARRRRAAAAGSWRYVAWRSMAIAWVARQRPPRRRRQRAARRPRRRPTSRHCACSAIWTTATVACGGWCPPSRPTRKSAKWRSCSTLSTTSWTCSWRWRRTLLCWDSRHRPRHRSTRPGLARSCRRGPRSPRSTLTRPAPWTNRATAFSAAEPRWPGVRPPEHRRARSPRKGGPEQKLREKSHPRNGKKNLQQI